MPSCPDVLYRLRPYSLVSLKELLYGEVYFSSLKELADPYDTKVYYRFKSDLGRYQRLLKSAFGNIVPAAVDLSLPASRLCGANLSYEELIERVSSQAFNTALLESLLGSDVPDAFMLAPLLIAKLKHEIHKRVGRLTYVACFTSRSADPLLWSLHASNHTGFALQVAPVNGSLFQHPLRRPVIAKYENGSYKYREGLTYQFREVSYVDQILPLNGFYNFNAYVYGEDVSEESIQDFWKRYDLVTTTKYQKWAFEAEYRLVDTSDWMPPHVTEDGPQLRKAVDRIFYYDQTQLQGIVFGMNMQPDQKDELIRTAEVMRDRLFQECNGCVPPFLFYQAKQDHSKYKINTEPVLGLDMNNHRFEASQLDEKKREFKLALHLLQDSGKVPEFAGLSPTMDKEST